MNNNYPIGICSQMCPDEEIIRRGRQGRLHILETPPGSRNVLRPQANIDYVVKEFTRSAAGKFTQDVKNLRTQDALLQTVDYLLHDVISNDTVSWNVIYDFIMDRLRAVRQDMVIQNLPRAFCISLLQPMVKFYVYAAYRLGNQPISIFDAHINNTHLQECLKRLLSMYDDFDILVSKVSNHGDTIQKNNILYSQCRPFMESLYVILNLGNTTAMDRALHLSPEWKNSLVRICLKISLEYWRGNFVRVCKEIKTLPPLLAACAALHIPKIRKKALATMSAAYSCKNVSFSFPADVLKEWLIYNDEQELMNDCVYYGIVMENDKIIFNKLTFQQNKTEVPLKHLSCINSLLCLQNIPYLLLEEDFEKLY